MATGYWMLVEDPVFSGNTGCWMVGSELATLQVRDYGQRTNKKIMRFSEKLKYSQLCDRICQTAML